MKRKGSRIADSIIREQKRKEECKKIIEFKKQQSKKEDKEEK